MSEFPNFGHLLEFWRKWKMSFILKTVLEILEPLGTKELTCSAYEKS